MRPYTFTGVFAHRQTFPANSTSMGFDRHLQWSPAPDHQASRPFRPQAPRSSCNDSQLSQTLIGASSILAVAPGPTSFITMENNSNGSGFPYAAAAARRKLPAQPLLTDQLTPSLGAPTAVPDSPPSSSPSRRSASSCSS